MKAKFVLFAIAFTLGILLGLLFSWSQPTVNNLDATATYGAEQFHIQLTQSAP